MSNLWNGLAQPLKNRPGDAMPDPVRTARAKQANVVKKEPRFPDVENPWKLSSTQCAVLAMVVDGLSPKEIGAVLSRSFKTVEVHIERVREKMEVRTTLRAAILWDRRTRAQEPQK